METISSRSNGSTLLSFTVTSSEATTAQRAASPPDPATSVLAAERDRLDVAFDRVVVECDAPVVKEAAQGSPPGECVGSLPEQGFRGRVMPLLKRRELYDLVWSMLVIKVAESFGLSDVGLAKVCDRHRVPVPPRGYWARKEAGKKVKQAIFAEVDDPFLDRVEITSARDALPEPVREIVERRRSERKAATRASRSDLMTPPQSDPVKRAPSGSTMASTRPASRKRA